MSQSSIEFALQTSRKRSSQEIEREEKFFNIMFKVLGEVVPTHISEKTSATGSTVTNFDNFANERELDTTRKIIYTDTDQYGYRFAVSSSLSIQELTIVLKKYSVDTVTKEDCLNGIPPCTVYLSRAN